METEPHTQARLFVEAGQPERALAVLEAGIRPLQFSRALILLSQMKWREGFAAYLHRTPRWNFQRMNPRLKLIERWSDFHAHDTAIIGEQGIGDQLTFMRWFNPSHAAPLYCDPKLAPILPAWMNARPITQRVVENHAVMLGDLPYLLGANGLPPPLNIGYPVAPATNERPFIGIAWQSGTPPADQAGASVLSYKSFPLTELIAITNTLHCHVVIVQRNPDAGSLEYIARHSLNPVTDFSALNENLAAMLLVLAGMDHYIGVSSTLTHLLASLEKPAYIMVPWPADYRFPGVGQRSPWFPTFTVQRQQANGSWVQAIQDATLNLQGEFFR